MDGSRCSVRGSFVYHPAYQHHTIRNRSDAPIAYVMFKWQSCPLEVDAPLQSHVFHWDRPSPPAGSGPMWYGVVLEAPTAYLTKLHAHQTVLQPGAGYAEHSDEYDVAIIVMSGTIRTAGQDIGPRGIVFSRRRASWHAQSWARGGALSGIRISRTWPC